VTLKNLNGLAFKKPQKERVVVSLEKVEGKMEGKSKAQNKAVS
jgi:hypothetical protein